MLQSILVLALWIIPGGLWLWPTPSGPNNPAPDCAPDSLWSTKEFSLQIQPAGPSAGPESRSVNEPCAEIWHLALTSIFSVWARLCQLDRTSFQVLQSTPSPMCKLYIPIWSSFFALSWSSPHFLLTLSVDNTKTTERVYPILGELQVSKDLKARQKETYDSLNSGHENRWWIQKVLKLEIVECSNRTDDLHTECEYVRKKEYAITRQGKVIHQNRWCWNPSV